LAKKAFHNRIAREIKRAFTKLYRFIVYTLFYSILLKLPRFLFPTIRSDLAIIDDVFPQKIPMAFRNAEINEYFKIFDNCNSFAMPKIRISNNSWQKGVIGNTKNQYTEKKEGYLTHYPENKDRIHFLSLFNSYEFKLAYIYFLTNVSSLLPILEANKVPFSFVLYPGGGFLLNNDASDTMLFKVCSSKYFRKVIVTQNLTKEYLLTKKLCSEEKIELVFGGFVQFDKSDLIPKRYYKKDKKTFDICFMAMKYTEAGIDKGYDLFIEAAKILAETFDDFRFHVIGPWTTSDMDVSALGEKITFYGIQPPSFFPQFFSSIDIFLSPNRLNMIKQGAFDGFPLGADAGYNGVAMFVTDELGMNDGYYSEDEIVIIKPETKDIVEKVQHYYNNPSQLRQLSINCMKKTHRHFETEHQISSRVKIIKKLINS
jgi:glycosyltransferase involved in cell wall biosynthesis